MKRSLDFDEELYAEVEKAAELVREKPSTVIRLAIRAGLPQVTSRFQGPRPDGYFAEAYRNWPKERLELEAASGKVQVHPRDR